MATDTADDAAVTDLEHGLAPLVGRCSACGVRVDLKGVSLNDIVTFLILTWHGLVLI